MNNLPKVVTQQRHGRASNPRLLDRKSDALPLSHRATQSATEMLPLKIRGRGARVLHIILTACTPAFVDMRLADALVLVIWYHKISECKRGKKNHGIENRKSQGKV